jgi:hypothetical protein
MSTEEKRTKQRKLQALREAFIYQVLADPEKEMSYVAVACVVAFHLNVGTLDAFPGFGRIAKLAHRSTVVRAIQWLEQRGHLRVKRSRRGSKNDSNRYIPVLRKTASRAAPSVAKTTDHPSVIATDHPSVIATVPEPITEPLNQPIALRLRLNDVGVGNEAFEAREESKGDFRESRGSTAASPPSSVKAECFRIARAYWHERGASIVAEAFQKHCEEWVLEEVRELAAKGADVDELAHALWVPEN